ncbi:hypothetical protein TrRE_jg1556, partial [Triparma retinervis]
QGAFLTSLSGSGALGTTGSVANWRAQTVEDAPIPEYEEGKVMPPPNFQWLRVCEDIMQTFPGAAGAGRRFWNNSLGLPEFQDIVSDGFWWVMVHVVKEKINREKREKEEEEKKRGEEEVQEEEKGEEDDHRYDDPFFRRLSKNFVRMFEKIPFSKKDHFFGHFPDVMTFTLLLSFNSAYPRSRSKIDDDNFKQQILDLCSEWTTGFVSSKKSSLANSWVFEHDLQDAKTTNAAERMKHLGENPSTPSTSRRKLKQQMEKLKGEGAGEGAGVEEGHMRPVRMSHVLKHSPFMSTYLKGFGTYGDNRQLEVKVGLSFSPTRPVVTFENKKVVGKAQWMSDCGGKNGIDRKKEQAMFRETERRAESTAKELKKLYHKQRKEFKEMVLDTKNREADVMKDLHDLERKMLKSEKTDFANKLVEGRERGEGRGR